MRQINILNWPYGADIAFAIRDDDLSYFTSSEKLETLYRSAWDMKFKVSFAAIPLHKSTNKLNIPPNFRNKNEYHRLDKNKNLIGYLKSQISKGIVGISLHGLSHTENTNIPQTLFNFEKGIITTYDNRQLALAHSSEFYGLNEDEIYLRIRDGKIILEEALGFKIKTFISPQEYLSRSLWSALLRNELNYCGGFSKNLLTQVPIDINNIFSLMRFGIKRCLSNTTPYLLYNSHTNVNISAVSPTYRHYWNKFLSDDKSKENFDLAKKTINDSALHNSYFILLTHHWEYFYDWNDKITQKNQYNYLNKILSYANNSFNIWKCTLDELIDWINAKESILIKDGGDILKITSPVGIRGLTILSERIDIEKLYGQKKIMKIKTDNNNDLVTFDIAPNDVISVPLKGRS